MSLYMVPNNFDAETDKIAPIYNQQSSVMIKAVQTYLITGTIFFASLNGLFPQKEIRPRSIADYISSNYNYEPINYDRFDYNEVNKENNYLYKDFDFQQKSIPNVLETNIMDSEMNPLKKEEDIMMYQKLVRHRNNVEKYGIITGTVLGTFLLIPSIFALVDFAAVVPASLLFFSLPVFILMRKHLRGDDNK